MNLMQTLIRDSQIKSARELARQQRQEAKEESRFGFAKSLLKTGLQFVPGVGKILSAGVDIIGDPIARQLGAGADADDIKLSGGNLAFGGEQSAKDARIGLKDYLDSAKQGSILSGVTSLASYGLDKGWDKSIGGIFKDTTEHGNLTDAIARETGIGGGAYAKKVAGASGKGDALYENYLDKFFEGQDFDVTSDMLSRSIPQTGSMYKGIEESLMDKAVQTLGSQELRKGSILDNIQKVSESGLNLPQGVSQMSRYADGATHSPQDIINALMKNPSDIRYLEDMGYTPDMLRRYASSKMPTYEQGGMVQKYEDGGEVAYMQRTSPAKYEGYGPDRYEVEPASTVYDTYTYDGSNWNKTEEGLDALPSGGKLITQSEMDSYRSEQRTQDVSSTYMSDPTEHGIQEILKSPQLYSQVEAARAGNEGALANILEMVRQARPDLKGTNEALTESIKKILPNIDLYGQGYQDVLAEGATTLKGLTEQATGLRAQEATQRATSGIRTPGAQSSISEGLYSGAEDVYSGMQRGIQGEFDKSFGEFDEMVNLVS